MRIVKDSAIRKHI